MSRKPRVLVFSSMLPFPINRGDRNRLFHVLRLLDEFAEVRLVCLSREWEQIGKKSGELGGVEITKSEVRKGQVVAAGLKAMLTGRPYQAMRFDIGHVRRLLTGQLDDYRPNIFWGFQISVYPFLKQAEGIRSIVDLVDSPSRFAGIAGATKELRARSRLASKANWRIRDYERLTIERSDRVLVSSTADKDHMSRIHGSGRKLDVLPNCVPGSLLSNQWRFDENRTPRALFVGNLAYPPNREAVEWLVKDFFPLASRDIPGLELIICGAGGESLADRYSESENIHFTGYVEDLVNVYLDASLLIAPLAMATGSQYKVLESLAVGLPVLSSRAVAAACSAVPGNDVLIADTLQDFSSAAKKIVHSASLSANLSDSGRALIRANYLWEEKSVFLKQTVERALS
ncbi:MAG: glycosyltransferase family 4 protein [Thermoleophilia bacterium]